jgi:hypothetical protein
MAFINYKHRLTNLKERSLNILMVESSIAEGNKQKEKENARKERK